MADVRPFRGLRYDPARAGSLSAVIAPPYDVISPALQQALYNASPHNVVRLEYGLEAGDQRYATAGRLMHEWRTRGILARDPLPAFYLYEQSYRRGTTPFTRRAVFGRVRLEPFERGVIRPHEYTMSGPKEDRLRLMQATHANVSPIFSLYQSDQHDPLRGIAIGEGSAKTAAAVDAAGERHTLLPLRDSTVQAQVMAFLARRTLYIADGHHRYETALRFRDEAQAASSTWSGDEPENFVLMALTPHADPGLLILPIHRIVRPKEVPADLRGRLQRFFVVETLPGTATNPATVVAAEERLNRTAGSAFVVAGVEPERLLLLTLRDKPAVEALMPVERSAAWKALDVNVLQYGVLDTALAIDLAVIAAGEAVEFTEDAEEAVSAVNLGQAPLAFLVNATRPEHIFAVADAGDRMPQKSTYFYPKLGTGLVIHLLEE